MLRARESERQAAAPLDEREVGALTDYLRSAVERRVYHIGQVVFTVEIVVIKLGDEFELRMIDTVVQAFTERA